MRQRGRKSAAASEVATVDREGAIATVRRPDPPLDLTPEESTAWVEVVASMPADWFPPETWGLLRQWCRHMVTARRVAQMIDAAVSKDEIEPGEMKDLLAMQSRETASIKAMASAMRISQQASYHLESAGTKKAKRTTMARPWES